MLENSRRITLQERKRIASGRQDEAGLPFIRGGSREYLKWLSKYAIMAIAKKDIVLRVHKAKAPELQLRGFHLG